MLRPRLTPVKDSHCSYCGDRFAEQKLWPRTCFKCDNESYKNPIPVAVAIVPVIGKYKTDVKYLIEKRGIEPKKGGWALPGGYINHAETWEHAIVRELQEEMNLSTQEKDFRLLSIRLATDDNMLIFCAHRGVSIDDIKFIPNDEVEGYELISVPSQQELCFPTHNEVLGQYFHDLEND